MPKTPRMVLSEETWEDIKTTLNAFKHQLDHTLYQRLERVPAAHRVKCLQARLQVLGNIHRSLKSIMSAAIKRMDASGAVQDVNCRIPSIPNILDALATEDFLSTSVRAYIVRERDRQGTVPPFSSYSAHFVEWVENPTHHNDSHLEEMPKGYWDVNFDEFIHREAYAEEHAAKEDTDLPSSRTPLEQALSVQAGSAQAQSSQAKLLQAQSSQAQSAQGQLAHAQSSHDAPRQSSYHGQQLQPHIPQWSSNGNAYCKPNALPQGLHHQAPRGPVTPQKVPTQKQLTRDQIPQQQHSQQRRSQQKPVQLPVSTQPLPQQATFSQGSMPPQYPLFQPGPSQNYPSTQQTSPQQLSSFHIPSQQTFHQTPQQISYPQGLMARAALSRSSSQAPATPMHKVNTPPPTPGMHSIGLPTKKPRRSNAQNGNNVKNVNSAQGQ